MTNDLETLAQCLSGHYDNRTQALADPVWYVHLHCWIRPVPLFADDSRTFFAEQAPVLQLDRPYRQRLIRLRDTNGQLTAQFYSFQHPDRVSRFGQDPRKLDTVLQAEIDELPGCILNVTKLGPSRYSATPPPNCTCQFSYPDPNGQPQIGQVELGFEVSPSEFHSYDKGLNPTTQKPIWGALMGPYRYTKITA